MNLFCSPCLLFEPFSLTAWPQLASRRLKHQFQQVLLLLSLSDGRLTWHTNMFRIRNSSWTNTNSDRKHRRPTANRKDKSLTSQLFLQDGVQMRCCMLLRVYLLGRMYWNLKCLQENTLFALWHLFFSLYFISPKGLWDGDITKYFIFKFYLSSSSPKLIFFSFTCHNVLLVLYFQMGCKSIMSV